MSHEHSPPASPRYDGPPSAAAPRHTGPLALATVLTLAAPPAYLLTQSVPLLRSTALVPLVLFAVAVPIALRAWRDRRLLARLVAGFNLAFAAFFLWGFFVMSRMPPPQAPALTQAPGFTLPDAEQRPVQLSQVLGRGPVLLVFYRGHW